MTDGAIDMASIEAELEQAFKESHRRYEETMREVCLRFGITGGNADHVLETGALVVNGISLTLVAGSLADPWTLQIITSVEQPVEVATMEEFYKGLLLANTMMAGSGSVFGLNPDTGEGMAIAHLSMREAHFNADYLTNYLHQMTTLQNELKDKLPTDVQFA